MARKRAGSKRSRAGSRMGRARSTKLAGRFGLLLRVCLGAILAVSIFLGALTTHYVLKLDRLVLHRLEGRRFEVPSKVLSAPTILYPGLNWKRMDLPGLLERQGYRKIAPVTRMPLGRYRWGTKTARVHLRPFNHPSRAERARDVVFRLDGPFLEEIREAGSGREIGALLVEPELMGSYYGPDREQREIVRLDRVPQHLIDAVLAVEDKRFEQHHGLDPKRIVGAFLTNLRAGGVRQGGSTLTQQLVKNFFLTSERTYSRKFQETLMALIVELRYEKTEILEAYLNEIYLGQRGATAVHGVGEASNFYFGKSVWDVSVGEAALLAALIQGPNWISPTRHPERALSRRNLVLRLMYEQDRIDRETYDFAKKEAMQIAPAKEEYREARYFLDALRQQLPEIYDAASLVSEGLKIYSTLDSRLQRIATSALKEGLADLEGSLPAREQTLQGCLIVLRPQTGEVLAMVGGRDYSESQFNRCSQARRPAGSVFKPFVYIAGLEARGSSRPHITLADFLDDTPLTVSQPTGDWEPENYDHEFHGMVPVREALERSLNVATARLGQQVGIARVSEVAKRLGIESRLPRVPSLALGVADLSPLEVARAYATIANGGVRAEVHTFEDVVDKSGQLLERREIQFDPVLDPGAAYLAVSLLGGVVERGTARGIRARGFVGPIAGKTGTSDEERDAWFVGFTPELVAVVWVGFDEPESIGVPGSRAALPIWASFMSEAVGKRVRGGFARPANIVEIDIDPLTGMRALPGCPQSRPELFLVGTEPEEACPNLKGYRRRPEHEVIDSLLKNVIDWLRKSE